MLLYLQLRRGQNNKKWPQILQIKQVDIHFKRRQSSYIEIEPTWRQMKQIFVVPCSLSACRGQQRHSSSSSDMESWSLLLCFSHIGLMFLTAFWYYESLSTWSVSRCFYSSSIFLSWFNPGRNGWDTQAGGGILPAPYLVHLSPYLVH